MKKLTVAEETKKVMKRAAQFGAVLAIVCQLLPHHYKVICEAVAQICRGQL